MILCFSKKVYHNKAIWSHELRTPFALNNTNESQKHFQNWTIELCGVCVEIIFTQRRSDLKINPRWYTLASISHFIFVFGTSILFPSVVLSFTFRLGTFCSSDTHDDKYSSEITKRMISVDIRVNRKCLIVRYKLELSKALEP